jgi:putative heme-binding domain-containing protein
MYTFWLAVIRCIICFVLTVATLAAQEGHGYTTADIERGGQLFLASCANCHGPDGDAIPAVDLSSGRFRHAASDEELVKLIQRGIPGTPMPPSSYTERQASTVVAFLRTMNKSGASRLAGGDAMKGKAIVEGSGQCLRCHRIQGRGGFLGPDLSAMGSTRRTEELERALLDPSADIRLDNHTARWISRDGKQVIARLLNQDTYRLQVIDGSGQLLSQPKQELREFEIMTASPMPGYEDRLSTPELAAVVAYLKTLKRNFQ